MSNTSEHGFEWRLYDGDLAACYRFRTGNHHVRFYVKDDTVVIAKIGHRSDFYED